MSSNERKLQTMGVSWLKMALPNVLVIAVINELPQTSWATDEERKANLIRMTLMKAMGLYPGAADLILLWQANGLQIRFLETKDKAPQSIAQKEFQKRLEGIGGIYYIWRSLPELEALCRSWGLIPAAPVPKGATPATKKQLKFNMLHELRMELAAQDRADKDRDK